jgi:hypothetical protein
MQTTDRGRGIVSTPEKFDEVAFRADLVARAEALVRSTSGQDIFTVISEAVCVERLRYGWTFGPNSDHLSSPVELLALLLASRASRAPAVVVEEECLDPFLRADAIVRDLILGVEHQRALDSSAMRPIYYPLLAQSIFVRNYSYGEDVAATNSLFLLRPEIDAICKSATGCTAADVISVLTTIETAYFDTLGELMVRFSDGLPGARTDEDFTTAAGGPQKLKEFTSRVADATREIDVHAIAVATGCTRAVVCATLDLFSLPLGEADTAARMIDFASGLNPLRTRPILRDSGGTYCVVHPHLLVHAIRPRIEEAISDAGLWSGYHRTRSDFLDNRAEVLLRGAFPTGTTWVGLEYMVPANDTQIGGLPSDYTRKVEGDVLAVIDDIAIVIETKGNTVRTQTYITDRATMETDFRNMVTKGTEQVNRYAQRITEDGGIRLADGTWLDLSHVLEVHTVVLSLDDLPAVAVSPVLFYAAGLLTPEERCPWLVSLHDLQQICEGAGRPAEIVLYLRIRMTSDFNIRFHAVDELDCFLAFMAGALWEDLPEHHDVTGYTTELDMARMIYEATGGTTPESPPYKASAACLGVVDEITLAGCPGWLSASASILASRMTDADLKDLLVRCRDSLHGGTHEIISRSLDDAFGGLCVAWIMLPEVWRDSLDVVRFAEDLAIIQYATKSARALGFVVGIKNDQHTTMKSDQLAILKIIGRSTRWVQDLTKDQLVLEKGITIVASI